MKKIKLTAVNTVIVLLLFFVFTGSVFLVLLSGMNSYNSISSSSELSYNERTGVAYLTERLRHGDSIGAVHVGEFDGLNALFIDSDNNGFSFNSIIYYYDGWLCELFCEKDAEFQRTDGIRIVEASSVIFSEPASNLLYMESTDLSGKTDRLHLYLRSGGVI